MIITNLLTNMIVVAMQGVGVIPTNTPAFQEYALHTMLTNAEALAVAWHLDETCITTNKIIHFVAIPCVSGFGGTIEFDRYGFEYHNGYFVGFSDGQFDMNDTLNLKSKKRITFGSKGKVDASLKKWLVATNLLSLDKAKVIAGGALLSLGCLPGSIELTGRQETYTWGMRTRALRRG